MAGTKEGAKRAAATNRKRYGEDFYSRIGSKGGTQTYESGQLYYFGFAANRERAVEAGRKGGSVKKS